jgi:hypothetical protein
MDFSKVDKKALFSDLVKVATFNIFAHLLISSTYNEPLFAEKFVYSLVYILMGFAVYHVLIHKHLMKFIEGCDGSRKDPASK